eukprot:6305529-Prymnesium_polylepis.1
MRVGVLGGCNPSIGGSSNFHVHSRVSHHGTRILRHLTKGTALHATHQPLWSGRVEAAPAERPESRRPAGPGEGRGV